jgi:hypothetical protein
MPKSRLSGRLWTAVTVFLVLAFFERAGAPAQAPAPENQELSVWDVALRLNEMVALAAKLQQGRLTVQMTPTEMTKLLGPPKRKARQILYRRYLEQWIYDSPIPLCVTFNCPRGQDPVVLTVHLLTRANP